MGWFILKHLLSFITNLLSLRKSPSLEKDLEILILRQQLGILQRKLNTPQRIHRIEKLTLAMLTEKFKRTSQRSRKQLGEVIRIFQPETVLRWHRELVRRKWTYRSTKKKGRPPINKSLERLAVRLANENPRWGYGKIHGEMIKLRYKISRPSIRNILIRYGIVPAPLRNGRAGWQQLMSHYKGQILACDFFTVETVWLKTLYVLFFIELGTRRVYFAGVTSNPDSMWVTQQARQIVWRLKDNESSMRFLIRDNDSKFSESFDAVFESEGMHVIRTPFQAPNANAYAERWVRTVREECLDHLLIFGIVHLKSVLLEYIGYYNACLPHQGLGQKIPVPGEIPKVRHILQYRAVLGGIIRDYYWADDQTGLSLP